MANLNEAIENVRSQARLFQSVIDLADALGEVQSIEQGISEAKVRLVSAQKEAEWLKATNENAKNDAVKLLADAEASAHAMVEEARVEVQTMRDNAKTFTKNLIDKADKAVAKAADHESALQARAEELNQRIVTDTEVLAELDAKILRARNKLQEMLGV